MTKEMIAFSGSLLLAIVGYLFTYFHQRRRDRRQSRLERVNLQLRNLYGPLYAALHANNATWDAFAANYWPAHGGRSYFEDGKPLTKQEEQRWRLWMTEVFAPQNARIGELIVQNGDLVEDRDFPAAFVAVLAHIAAYRAVIKEWEARQYGEHTSILNFPREQLLVTVEPIYHRLRAEQSVLIGQVQAVSRINPDLPPPR